VIRGRGAPGSRDGTGLVPAGGLRQTASMKHSTRTALLFGLLLLIVAAVFLLPLLRSPCRDFAGPGVTAADLPPSRPGKGKLRIGTWNVRNFPADERRQYPDLAFSRRTNTCDLEAVLRDLGTHVLGVEEIRKPGLFRSVLKGSGAGGRYRIVFTRGGGQWGQHVGIAWDQDSLRLADGPVEVRTVELNPKLRPALAVYLRSTRKGGVDFSIVQVHLRAGPRGFEERLEQYRRLARWLPSWVARVGDADVIVQGDFNTTGPRGGRLEDELREADRILGQAGLRRLENASGCSEYWEGPGDRDGVQLPSLLDQVYVAGFQELDEASGLEAWLHCARYGCRPFVSRPGREDGTFWDVSDHCPLTFEIRDRDLD